MAREPNQLKEWFPSDLAIALSTAGAEVTVAQFKQGSKFNTTKMTLVEYINKKTTPIEEDEMLWAIHIPLKDDPDTFYKSIKSAKRLQHSHALVNMGLRIAKNETTAMLNIGGGNPKVAQPNQEVKLDGSKGFTAQGWQAAMDSWSEQLKKMWQDLGWTEKYISLGLGLFKKLCVSAAANFKFIDSNCEDATAVVDVFTERFNNPTSGAQDFPIYSYEGPVSEPWIKDEAILASMGALTYTHDVDIPVGTNFAAYVLTQCQFGEVNAIKDPEDSKRDFVKTDIAKKFPGTKIITSEDIKLISKDSNNITTSGYPGLPGDTVLVDKICLYNGQPLVLVVHPSYETSKAVALYLNGDAHAKYWEYDCEGYTPVTTIEESQKLDAFFPFNYRVSSKAPSLCEQVPETSDLNKPPTEPFGSTRDMKPSFKPPKVSESTFKGDLAQATKTLTHQLTRGLVTEERWEEMKQSDDYVCVEGSISTAAQYHFYMETQSCMVKKESGRYVVNSACQSPTGLMDHITNVLQVPASKVLLDIKMLGGGFGGKAVHYQFPACAAAAACKLLDCPIFMILDRNTDMAFMGKRHPFKNFYRLAWSKKTGTLDTIWLDLNSNAGCTLDCSFFVMELATQSADNAYYAPNYLVNGTCWFTNYPTSTAMRSFGLAQSVYTIEQAFEHLSRRMTELDPTNPTDPAALRSSNFYGAKHYTTPFGQDLKYITLEPVWNAVKGPERSNYDVLKEEVRVFNEKNKYKKRGLALIPLKYGVAYTGFLALNQDTAIIVVNKSDATVVVSTGGIDMGQGLNMKVKQTAARFLACPMENVLVASFTSDKIPHPSSTGASTGSDLKCGATKDAALNFRAEIEKYLNSKTTNPLFLSQQLKQIITDESLGVSDPEQVRILSQAYTASLGVVTLGENDQDLIPQLAENDGFKLTLDVINNLLKDQRFQRYNLFSTWYEKHQWYPFQWSLLVSQCFVDRVPLESSGYYKVKNINYTDQQYYYFTYAASCTVAEVDCLSGEVDLQRCDIMFDAGVSLNPAIDIGQVEGGYIQGLGMATSEDEEYTSAGRMKNNGTWEYKPPFNHSVPRQLNVSLYPGGSLDKHKASLKDSAEQDSDKQASPDKKYAQPKYDHTKLEDVVIDPHGVQSSKSTGEPPFVLSNSAFFAISNAVRAYNPNLPHDYMSPPATTFNIIEALNHQNNSAPVAQVSNAKKSVSL